MLAAVPFFGRTAQFPPSLIELAVRKRLPIHVYIGQWGADTLQPQLKVLTMPAAAMPDAQAQVISVLEREIRALGWDGGVGVYTQEHDWFVHADVGPNRRWGG